MSQTITFARPSAGVDANGDPSSIAAQQTVPARVQEVDDEAISADDDQIVASHVIYTSTQILPGDRIWCPTLGDDITKVEQSRHVVAIRQSPRLKGIGKLYKVFV